jgi:hypothetical protein
MNRRQGCLEGLLKLFLLNVLFDWLQDNLGWGRGGCGGCGCGIILLLIFMVLACRIIFNTDWMPCF